MNYLFLDFDGTLADSSKGIYRSFKSACTTVGLPAPKPNHLNSLIGPPIQNIALKLFPDLSPKNLELFRLAFRKDYDNHGYRFVNWYPKVIETIRLLRSRNDWHLSIITNKPTEPTIRLVEAARLSDCFSTIIGIDYLSYQKQGSVFSTKSDALEFARSTTPESSGKTFYVGDTPGDQLACTQNSVSFITATYGFHQWDETQLSRPFINCFSQVVSVLDSYITLK